MKKSIYAFLIVAIVVVAVALLIMKYPRSDVKETGSLLPVNTTVLPDTSSDSAIIPSIPSAQTPLGKLPDGFKPAPAVESLIGTTWMWEKTIMSDGTITTPKKNVFSVSFNADGKLNGKTDCNGFFGNYTIGSDGSMTFGPIGSTLMYCEGSQEIDFTKHFAEVSRYTSDNDNNLTLLLKNDSGAVVFTKK
jgi:heat shock protein HslJ